MELQTKKAFIHPKRAFRLHKNRIIPQRIALDPILLRRPDHKNLELPKQKHLSYFNRTFPLRNVCKFPPHQRLNRILFS